MANKKSNDKGVAIAKRSKIDSMRRNMFAAVCIASVILGVSIVGVIRLSKSIAFNSKVISEKEKIINGYTQIQSDLETLKDNVSNLVSNENLESVARYRANECYGNSTREIDNEEYRDQAIELARTCSALRVIPDALPSSNNMEATLSSMNQLLYWSNNKNGVIFESLSSDYGGDAGSEVTESVHVVSVNVEMQDTADNIHGALAEIENSVRNFDISSANISWNGRSLASGELKFSAIYSAYYSDPVVADVRSRTVCAKATSKKCIDSGGDKLGDAFGQSTAPADVASEGQ